MAGLGRFCQRRWWLVILAWIGLVVAGLSCAEPLYGRLVNNDGARGLESVAAMDILADATDRGGQVIGLVEGVNVRSVKVRQVIQQTATQLRAVPGVASVETPYDGGEGGGATPTAAVGLPNNGNGFVVQIGLSQMDQPRVAAATDRVTTMLHASQQKLVSAGQPSAHVRVGGQSAIEQQANNAIREDLNRSERASLIISMAVLVIVFGGVMAAGLPIVVAIVSVASVTGLLLAFSLVTDLNPNAVTVTTLMGLGLSIDYSLLLVNRYREELGPHVDPQTAIGRAWSTAGRTILFSALTVAAALTGMLAFGITSLSALGIAGMSIAVVAMLASLTLTAAMLGLLRKRIRPARHSTRTPRAQDEETGFFAALSRQVQRWPWLTALGVSALLLAAAIPVLTTQVRLDSVATLPRSIESVQVTDTLAKRYRMPPAAAVTVLARTSPAALNAWVAQWRTNSLVLDVRPAVPVANRLSTVDIDVRGDPQGTDVRHLVDQIRANRPPGTASWVTGNAAVLGDVTRLIVDRLPLAGGITVVAMLILLFFMTGSLVVPIKAVVMNVVSLAATFGVMNAVFQHGIAGRPLDIVRVEGFNPVFVVIIFGFAFGLSMDYEVFLLARIKEYVDQGMEPATAVRRGLQQTGKIITSAALLMVVVMGCFAAARMSVVEQIGLGLAVAVAIDATLVRCVLVPATMTLLGRGNWWAPPFLARLHARLGLAERSGS
jgi:RND superfamily putative drug exporter